MGNDSSVKVIVFDQIAEGYHSWDKTAKREYAGPLAAEYLRVLQESAGNVFLVINPVDLQLMDDEDFQMHVDEWMLRSFKETSPGLKQELGQLYSQWIFHHKSITEALKRCFESGNAIGVPTALKEIPFTHYKSGRSIQEQIRQSKSIWKEYFHHEPLGFWLPKCAFMSGIERYVLDNDIQYVFTEKMGVDFAEPKREAYSPIIQTPHGLRIIGINQNDIRSNDHTTEIRVDHSSPLTEDILFEKEWPVAVPGFTYLGMRSGIPILSDEELLGMIRIHSSEEGEELPFQEVERDVRPLTVLLLSWEYPPNIVGGLSKHVSELAEGMSKKGIKVIVLTAGSPGLPEFETAGDVDIFRVRPIHENEREFTDWVAGLNIAMIETACQLLNKNSIQIIHAHDWLVSSAAGYLKKHFRLPIVTTIHSTEYGRNKGIYSEIQSFIHEKEKELIRISDEVIVCSDYMKTEIREQFDLQEAHMIPNGIKIPDMDSEDGFCGESWINGRKLVFSIGRMVGEKGFQTVIEAAERLADHRSSICFILAGKGPLLSHYRQMAANRGLEDFVHFPGFITDEEKNRLFHLASVSVFPSLYEPFGIVALEAMAEKSPLIASNTGGLKGIVQNNISGKLVEPNNSQELAEAIFEVIQSQALSMKLAENAYKMAQSLFGWDRISDQTIDVYKDLWLKHQIQEPVQMI